jgi:hypothetical protein
MKIMALRIQPLAKALALIYIAFGFVFWASYCLIAKTPFLVLPIGIETAWVHLDFKFNVYRSHSALHYLSLLFGSIICYGVSGWLTATALVLGFNVIAKHTGGVNANFIVLKEREPEMAHGETAVRNSMSD